MRAGEHSAALVTDELVGSREIVVKALGPQIAGIRGIAGATILGDGRIVIILDTGALVRSEWRSRPLDEAVRPARDDRIFALVVDDSGRLLLARRAFEPDAGMWDALGGFLDEGEEPLEGLRRELAEEAGVEIEIGDFAGVFADRYGNGDDASAVLNLVWEATIAKGEPLPADDVAELRWFPRDALPPDGELAFNWLAPCLRAWAAKPPR